MEETKTTEVTGTKRTVVLVIAGGVVLLSAIAMFVPDSRQFATSTVTTLLGFVKGILQ